MAVNVTGDLYFELDGQLSEIKRQLRQKSGYPYDPEGLRNALQAIVEGRFDQVVNSLLAQHLSDDKVMMLYPDLTPVLEAWRKMTDTIFHDYPHQKSIVWDVPAGFVLKKYHAPKAGPCLEVTPPGLGLQGRDFLNKSTKETIVFWFPTLARDTSYSVFFSSAGAQLQLFDELRNRFSLPRHHLSGFGSPVLLANLILAYFRQAKEAIPLDGWVRTDDDVFLGFFNNTLYCLRGPIKSRHPKIGCFLLGVEETGR